MSRRLMAIAAMVIMIACALSPFYSESADAIEDNDYYVVIAGEYAPEEHIKTEIGNGELKTWTVTVINNSENYLNVFYDCTISAEDVKVTKMPESALLKPFGLEGNSSSDTITLAVDGYSQAKDTITVDFTISVFDIADKTTTLSTHVIFDVTVDSLYDTSGVYNKFFGIIPNTLSEPFNSVWFTAFVTLIGMLFASVIISLMLFPVISKFSSVAKHYEPKHMKKSFMKTALVISLVLAINLALRIVGASAGVISIAMSISTILVVAIGMFVSWNIYVFILDSILTGIEKKDPTSMVDRTLAPLFKMLGKIVIWVLAATIILGSFGVDLQGILVSAGVISLGITLGAQNVLSQFFSGIVILMSRPFMAGDFLKINGEIYVVRKVKVMYTEFTGWDKDQIITMPNNVVSSATIHNLSKNDTAYRQYVFFSVAYGSDLKKAEEIMLEEARKCKLVLNDSKHAPPNVRLTNFQDSGIELRLGVTVIDFDNSSLASGMLRAAILKAFEDNDIEVPYNRLEVMMLKNDADGKNPGDSKEA